MKRLEITRVGSPSAPWIERMGGRVMTMHRGIEGEGRRLLMAQEVADKLSVSLRTVRRLIAQEKLEVVCIGKVVRIKPETLDLLIEGE